MSRADDERIEDIAEAAHQIGGIVAAGREAWDADHVRRLAVERLLEIIGESARAMTDSGRARHPDVPWSDIVGLWRWDSPAGQQAAVAAAPTIPEAKAAFSLVADHTTELAEVVDER